MREEYEVPSPHEKAVEAAGESRFDSMVQRIALMIAVLISYHSGSAQNEAMFLKNQSILKQAEASDQFAFYQAKSVKSHIAEAVASVASAPETKARFHTAQAKEDTEKAAILVDAKRLQEESKALGEKSEAKR